MNTIIFDLGNVLLDLDFNHLRRGFGKLLGASFDLDQHLKAHSGLFLDFELGRMVEAEFLEGLVALADRPVGAAELKKAWNSMLLEIPVERMAFLRALSTKYRLYLLSNTNYTHIQWLDGHLQQQHGINLADFEGLFEEVFYSFAIHLRKPETDIFDFVIEKTGIDPAQALFIDDGPTNIEGAQKVGLNGQLHDPKNRIELVFEQYLQ